MSSIKYDADQHFPFPELHLANPTGLQGGAYFSKLTLNEKKIFVQMPKCKTKTGIHRTGKKIYTDLMFDTSNERFDEWVQNLSTRVKTLIYEIKDIWFQNEMTYDDIEYHWQNITRSYKKKHLLLRCIIKKPRNINMKELVMVYDEDENIISLDDIKCDSSIIPLLEITGLKFTTQSFLLEFALKQVMVLNETDDDECLISISKAQSKIDNTQDNPIVALPLVKLEQDGAVVHKQDTENGEHRKMTEVTNLEHSLLESGEQTSLGNSDNKVPINTNENIKNAQNSILEGQPVVPLVDVNAPASTVEDPAPAKDVGGGKDESEKREHLEKNIKDTKQEDIYNNSNTLEKKLINEVELEYPVSEDVLALKKPDEVYLAIYQAAKRKAKEAKRAAIQAYLEVKRIKNKYMLDEIESSDDEFEMGANE